MSLTQDKLDSLSLLEINQDDKKQLSFDDTIVEFAKKKKNLEKMCTKWNL